MLAVCNGMFRAGSTLQYNIARLLLEESETGRSEDFFEEDHVAAEPQKFLQWEDDEVYHLIKMHDLYRSPRVSEPGIQRVRTLYIYRDIRDVAASLKIKLKIEGDALDAMLDKAVAVSNQIMDSPAVLCQRYEDVRCELPRAIVDIAVFLGINATAGVVAMVTDACSLDAVERNVKNANRKNLKRQLRIAMNKMGFRRLIYDRETLLHHNHISRNKGTPGVWRTGLSLAEQHRITERYRAWLEARDYL